jgi:hypothetical protein
MAEGKGAFGVLVGTRERKRPLGRTRYRCDANIKVDLQEE